MNNQQVPDFIQNIGSDINKEQLGVFNTTTQQSQVPDFISNLQQPEVKPQENNILDQINQEPQTSSRLNLGDIMNQHKDVVNQTTSVISNMGNLYKDREVEEQLGVELERGLTDDQKQEYVNSLTDQQWNNWNQLKNEGYSFEARKALTDNEDLLWDITAGGLDKYIDEADSYQNMLSGEIQGVKKSLEKSANRRETVGEWNENIRGGVSTMNQYIKDYQEFLEDYSTDPFSKYVGKPLGIIGTSLIGGLGDIAGWIGESGLDLSAAFLDLSDRQKIQRVKELTQGTPLEDKVPEKETTILGDSVKAAETIFNIATAVPSKEKDAIGIIVFSALLNRSGEEGKLTQFFQLLPQKLDQINSMEIPGIGMSIKDYLEEHGDEDTYERFINIETLGSLHLINVLSNKVLGAGAKYLSQTKAGTTAARINVAVRRALSSGKKGFLKGEGYKTSFGKGFKRSREQTGEMVSAMDQLKARAERLKQLKNGQKKPEEIKGPKFEDDLNLDNPPESLKKPLFGDLREKMRNSFLGEITDKLTSLSSDNKLIKDLGIDRETIQMIKENPESWELLKDLLSTTDIKTLKESGSQPLQKPVEALIEKLRDRITRENASLKANKKVLKKGEKKTTEYYYERDTLRRNLTELSRMIGGEHQDPMKVLENLLKLSEKNKDRFEKLVPGFKKQIQTLQTFATIVDGLRELKPDRVSWMIDLFTPAKKRFSLSNYAIRKLMNYFKDMYAGKLESAINSEKLIEWIDLLNEEDLKNITKLNRDDINADVNRTGIRGEGDVKTRDGGYLDMRSDDPRYEEQFTPTDGRSFKDFDFKELMKLKNNKGKTAEDMKNAYNLNIIESFNNRMNEYAGKPVEGFFHAGADTIVGGTTMQDRFTLFHELSHNFMARAGMMKTYRWIKAISEQFHIGLDEAAETFADLIANQIGEGRIYGELKIPDYNFTPEQRKFIFDINIDKEIRKDFSKALEDTYGDLFKLKDEVKRTPLEKELTELGDKIADIDPEIVEIMKNGSIPITTKAGSLDYWKIVLKHITAGADVKINDLSPVYEKGKSGKIKDINVNYEVQGESYTHPLGEFVDFLSQGAKDRLENFDMRPSEEGKKSIEYKRNKLEEDLGDLSKLGLKREDGYIKPINEEINGSGPLPEHENRLTKNTTKEEILKENDYSKNFEQFEPGDADLLKRVGAYRENGELMYKERHWRKGMRLSEAEDNIEWLRNHGASETLMNYLEGSQHNVPQNIKEDYEFYKKSGIASKDLEELMEKVKANGLDLDWYFNN